MMPTTGAVDSTDPNAYRSTFTHADEQADAGLLPGRPDRYGINAELTATARTGWQRYTFPATGTGQRAVQHRPGEQGVQGSTSRSRRRRPTRSRAGSTPAASAPAATTPHVLHRHLRPAVRGLRHLAGRARSARRGRDAAGTGGNGAWVTLRHDDRPATCIVKVGLSYTGLDGARGEPRRRDRRLGFDFDATRAAAARPLGRRCSTRSRSSGGDRPTAASPSTPRCTTRCCTRTWPATSTAATSASTARCTPRAGYTPYQNFSLWDTYRPQNQLLELLDAARGPRRRAVAARDRPRRRLAAALGAGQLARPTS